MKCYVVIDTNVVLSALMYAQKFKGLDSSVPLKVLSLALEGKNKIIPIINEEMLDEYKDVLSRKEFSIERERIGRFINDFRAAGLYMNSAEIDEELPDSDDVVFYQVVMEGRKTENSFLVTGNKRHFPAKDFIVSPSEFLERVAEFG